MVCWRKTAGQSTSRKSSRSRLVVCLWAKPPAYVRTQGMQCLFER